MIRELLFVAKDPILHHPGLIWSTLTSGISSFLLIWLGQIGLLVDDRVLNLHLLLALWALDASSRISSTATAYYGTLLHLFLQAGLPVALIGCSKDDPVSHQSLKLLLILFSTRAPSLPSLRILSRDTIYLFSTSVFVQAGIPIASFWANRHEYWGRVSNRDQPRSIDLITGNPLGLVIADTSIGFIRGISLLADEEGLFLRLLVLSSLRILIGYLLTKVTSDPMLTWILSDICYDIIARAAFTLSSAASALARPRLGLLTGYVYWILTNVPDKDQLLLSYFLLLAAHVASMLLEALWTNVITMLMPERLVRLLLKEPEAPLPADDLMLVRALKRVLPSGIIGSSHESPVMMANLANQSLLIQDQGNNTQGEQQQHQQNPSTLPVNDTEPSDVSSERVDQLTSTQGSAPDVDVNIQGAEAPNGPRRVHPDRQTIAMAQPMTWQDPGVIFVLIVAFMFIVLTALVGIAARPDR